VSAPAPATDGNEHASRHAARHAAPPQAHKLARVVCRAIPAVAVIGALAAAPHLWDALDSSAAPAPASHRAPQRAGPVTAAPPGGSPAAAGPSDNPATFRTSIDRPAVTATADARRRKHASRRRSRISASLIADSSPAGSRGAQRAASARTTAACSSSDAAGMLPENYATIVNFLTAHGYTGIAAAGIAGNIYQESKGNPESVGDGGGGLIGWTPLPAGYVTGNPAADLQTQLQALLAFNQQWAQFIPTLNAAASAAEAADIYVEDFERAGAPAAGNREAAATAVATACGL
jgi:hypothetical protein